jgi:DNA-binding LacI/PurR family transcriptional regulator
MALREPRPGTRVNLHWAAVMDGVDQQAAVRGLDFLVIRPRKDEPPYERALELLEEGRIDILLLPGFIKRHRELPPGVPAVVIQPPAACTQPAVSIDWQPGIEEMIPHLAVLGHQHVAYISSGKDEERIAAVSGVCRKHGLMFECQALDAHPGQGSLIGDELDLFRHACSSVRWSDKASVLIAGSDQLGLALLQTLPARGLSVPGDISVVCFDSLFAHFAYPRLAHVDHRLCALGREAVDLALALDGAEKSFASRVLPACYVKGPSVGPVQE